MEIGASCHLYKECSHCGLTLHYRKFPARGGGKQGPNARKSSCRSCQSRLIRNRKREAAALQEIVEPVEKSGMSPLAETASLGRAIDIAEPAPAVSGLSRSAKRRRKRKAAKRRTESVKSRLEAEIPTVAATEPAAAAVNQMTSFPFPEAPVGYPPGALEKKLRPRDGFISLKGKSDKGVRWKSPVDLETAILLVEQRAAVIVNASTIRRLYTNKSFKDYIMRRDHGICQYCGNHGDTLDHIVPKSKGGHTTPVNCVCACYTCNQEKASHDAEDYREWKRGASTPGTMGRSGNERLGVTGEISGIPKGKRRRRKRSRGRK